MFFVKEPSWAPYACGLQVVMPDMSAKSLCIYPHVCVSTWSVIEPLTFSDIYKNSQQCRTLYSDECFSILDHTSKTIQLKIKEAIHIQGGQATLNYQLCYVNLKLSL